MLTLAALSSFTFDASCGAASPASTETKHVDVIQACPDPITLHLRVARADGHGAESAIATCGLRINLASEMDGATSLFAEGGEGVLDIDLRLRDGERETGYRATGLRPGVGEVRLQRTGDNGPEVWAWSTRVSGGDFVAVEVVNMPAIEVAERMARAKGLQIDDIARYGKSRLTLKFARVPLDTMFSFLADVTEADTRRIGARHYIVRTQPHLTELRKAFAAVNSADPKEVEAGWEKIVAFGGTPTRGEDVYVLHFHATAALAAIALEHKELDKAQVLFRRTLALADLHDPGGHDAFYASTLVQLATVESKRGQQKAALALLLQAQQIVTDVEGSDGDSMTGVLKDMAAVQHELHDGAAEAALLDRALALANPSNEASFMVAQARRLTKANLPDRADAVLQRAYPTVRDRGIGNDFATTLAFEDADRELALAYRRQKRFAEVERVHRREIALNTRLWGADSSETSNASYYLVFDFIDQGRDAEAEAEMTRYIATDRDQPKLGLFRVDATEALTERRIGARDFAAAAAQWRDMAALRAKALGAGDASVVLALRETAILYALAGDEAGTGQVCAQARGLEQAPDPAAAVPDFAADADDRQSVSRRELMPELAQQALRALPAAGTSRPSEAETARADRVATTLEDYAETRLRTRKNLAVAISSYLSALQLLERAHEAEHARTARVALRLAGLYDEAGRADDAAALRARYPAH